MPTVGFEPKISAGERQGRLDRATTGIDYCTLYKSEIYFIVLVCLLQKSVSLHTEFAAVVHPAEGRAEFKVIWKTGCSF